MVGESTVSPRLYHPCPLAKHNVLFWPLLEPRKQRLHLSFEPETKHSLQHHLLHLLHLLHLQALNQWS